MYRGIFAFVCVANSDNGQTAHQPQKAGKKQINNIKNNDDHKVTLMLLNNENFKATLEITKDYEPDEIEQKLIDQLGSSLKQRTVGRVMTEGGQRGMLKLTIYDTDTNKIVAAKVYQKTDSLNLIKD